MLSEEEKKAIEYWKRDIELYHYNTQLASEHYAQIVLNLIEKQNKIIDKMADEIYDLGQKQDMRNDNITIWIDKEHILNYFTKLVEEKSK